MSISRVFLSMVLSVGLVACVEEAAPELGVAEGAVQIPTCHPNSQEPQAQPGGSCAYEVSLDEIANVVGQGASDPDMDVNVVASADASSVAWPGAMPATQEFTAGISKPAGKGNVIATYVVPAGQQRQVKLCAAFTEVDNGGINGQNDTGRACRTITLRADAAPGGGVICPSAPQHPVVAATLCGPNQCNGQFSAQFEVLVSDADWDGVANDDDFTPELCDEHDKGQLGRASLIWSYYGDGPMTTFFQAAGLDLAKAEANYDYVVLIIDPSFVGPVLQNAAAIAGADLVLSPTEANLYLAMQEITKRGYDMDVWVDSHGTQLTGDGGQTYHTNFSSLDTGQCTPKPAGELCANGTDDDADGVIDEAACTALPAGEICWNDLDDDGDGVEDENDGVWDTELVENLTPAKIGTTLVPIRAVYSIACFNQGMNWAWTTVGAKVTSGTQHINFYPVFYGGFADAWNTGSDYVTSAVLSEKPGDQFWAENYQNVKALTVDCDDISLPNNQEELLLVTDKNACAADYFSDSDGSGPDSAEYHIEPYDATKSGAANMRIESTRVISGNATIKKFVPARLTW